MRRSFTRPRFRARAGHVLLTVVIVLTAMGAATISILLYQSLAQRIMQARNVLARTGFAADGVVAVMRERVVALAEQQQGVITQADVDSLNAHVADLPVAEDVQLDTAATRYTVTAVRSGDILGVDAAPLSVTPSAPRGRWSRDAVVGGRQTATTIEVTVLATVTSQRGARRSASETLALATVPPFQDALATNGTAEVCAAAGTTIAVSGSIRVEGDLHADCAGTVAFAGALLAQHGVYVSGGGATLWTDAGAVALSTVDRDMMEANAQGALATFGGRVRIGSAVGDVVVPTTFQDAETAGSGECPDLGLPCGGAGAYFPSVELQHTTTGSDASIAIRCGYAYGIGGDCSTGITRAVRYVPFPFTAAPGARGVSWEDPAQAGTLWHGLFYDPRRESRCTATIAGTAFRTYRCSTNPYGYIVDVGALAPVAGGVVGIRRQTTTTSLTNPSGYQEVVLLTNATELTGPLTLVSEIPVYIQGNFNTVAPKPVLIDAPLVTVLPAETPGQLQTAQAWDSTGRNTPQAVTALTPVTVQGVLRGGYVPTIAGAGNFGGVLRQVGGVVGDWSAVHLTVIGAVEGRVRTGTDFTQYTSAFQAPGSSSRDLSPAEPATRTVAYDLALRGLLGTPKGSWFWVTTPGSGSRSPARQQRAQGGASLVRVVRSSTRGQFTLPTPTGVPALQGWMPPVLHVAQSPATAGQPMTLDASGSSDPNGQGIVSYFWTFPDGTIAHGARVTKTYPSAGPTSATLTIVDAAGLLTTGSIAITVDP